MKYIPAIGLLVIAVLFWLGSLGSKSGSAMPSSILRIPAALFAMLALLAGAAGWAL